MRAEKGLTGRLARDLDGCFEELVLAYQDRLFAFALRMLGDHRDAEEVAQDAFVRAYRALGGYDPERIRSLELRPWLYTIALNALRNRTRGSRPKLVRLSDHDRASAEPDPAAAAEASEEASLLAKHIAALPMRHRAAVLLRFFEDLSYEEIAATLGEPVGTVKSNVHRGVARLRAAMVQGGFPHE
jgi:RNA polymerase sigma-70 factor (ECF subfamily)